VITGRTHPPAGPTRRAAWAVDATELVRVGVSAGSPGQIAGVGLAAPARSFRSYSISSSARASKVGGTVMPSAFAVPRLMTSSNFVGCRTGRSAGLVPLRILAV
jgi:hypothetical protein